MLPVAMPSGRAVRRAAPTRGRASPTYGSEPTIPLLSVFAAAIVEIWAAVPAGLALGLNPLVVWCLTVAGSLTGVTIVALAGDRLRAWLLRRRGQGTVAGRGRLYRLWLRYGVVGWGVVSPLVFAPPMGTVIALALGAPRQRLLAWMIVGVLVWTSILVVAGSAGLSILRSIG